MLRKSFLLACLLLLAANVSGGQSVAVGSAQSERSGTWSARASSGRTLFGTWTATPDSTSGAVTGTWELVDAQGNRLATGGWSAAKAPGQWTGAWRAVVAGRAGEFAGTWTASDLQANGSFDVLFERAVEAVVNGTWRLGSQSGAWAIRTAKKGG